MRSSLADLELAGPVSRAAAAYGVLRSSGVAERAIVVVDKAGIIRFIDVHDINTRPDLGGIVRELDKLAH